MRDVLKVRNISTPLAPIEYPTIEKRNVKSLAVVRNQKVRIRQVVDNIHDKISIIAKVITISFISINPESSDFIR